MIFRYDYNYPYNYRRYGDPYYESYLTSTYRPYRSYLLDSMIKSLIYILELYCKSFISFIILDKNWLSSDYWDKRYKDYRQLYYWHDQSCYIPSYYNRRARQYYTEWAQ